jgi:protein tyrosine phosphatase
MNQKLKHNKIIVLILIVMTSIWAYDKFKYNILPKNFGVVEEGKIYRSGQLSKTIVKKILERHSIQCVVDLSGPPGTDINNKAESEACIKLGIQRYDDFSLAGDGTGDINSYVHVLEIIHKAVENNQPVLVHCAAGAQRTGGVIACYRLLFQKKSQKAILRELRRYGWENHENPDLVPYLNKNMVYLHTELVRKGILPETRIYPTIIEPVTEPFEAVEVFFEGVWNCFWHET